MKNDIPKANPEAQNIIEKWHLPKYYDYITFGIIFTGITAIIILMIVALIKDNF